MRAFLSVLFLVSFLGEVTFAAEPAFCDPAKFKNWEISYPGKNKPSNLHVYKVGGLTVAGLAVGNSRTEDVIALAQHYSKVGADKKYCTWYLNDGNDQAKELFNWHYVPRPVGSNFSDMSSIYMKELGDQFDQAAVNFVSCAVEEGYIAMGCDGMKHRGPSVFAMMLAYAGCTPEHAATIATQVWGSNGITLEMRKALAANTPALAAAHPDMAAKLQALMLAR